MEIKVTNFGQTKNGEKVLQYTLKNEHIEVEILNYGGIIRKLSTPDKNGVFENIVLGFDSIEEYEINSPYFGCIIGRTAGRIKDGTIKIQDKTYNLALNNGKNNIHGGINGLNKRVWKSDYSVDDKKASVILKTFSPHLEEGYPGNINFTVTYTLKENELIIDYLGETDQVTYLNLTNHSYFNLSGNLKRSILKQEVCLYSNGYLEVDHETLPIEVGKDEAFYSPNSPVMFEKPLTACHDQIKIVNQGYDHPFILSKDKEIDGWIYDKVSGRKLEFITDQPVVVIYTGNYLDEIKNLYENFSGSKHLGFCLETQDYPDIFNIFPEKVRFYSPEKSYTQKTIFKFSCENEKKV